MTWDVRPLPVPNSKLQTRNPKPGFAPSFTSSELPALGIIQNRRQFPNKISSKTGLQTEQIAVEEITNEDFSCGARSASSVRAAGAGFRHWTFPHTK